MKHDWKLDEAGKEQGFGMLMLAPTFLLILIFLLFPLGYSLWLSFQNVILHRPKPPQFVGFDNYVEILQNPIFLSSLWKTLYYSSSFLVGTLGLGMVVALILNHRFFGKKVVITCLLIPWAIPKVVNALIWKWIYDGNFGVLNAIALELGLIDSYKFWFGESPLVGLLLIAVANTWKFMPFVALLFLAALQTIPRELYESAKVDGANIWQSFVHITIPQLRFTMIIVLILQTMRAIKVFDIIAVLTHGGPGDRTMLPYYYVYRLAFEFLNISYSAAGAYIITVLITVLAVVYYKIFRGSEE